MAERSNDASASVDLAQITAAVASGAGLAVYFTAPDCGVCKVLRPRLRELIRVEFPRLRWFEVDVAGQREIAGQYQVFAIPTLLVFIDGREVLRRVRHLAPGAVGEELERPYRVFFESGP